MKTEKEIKEVIEHISNLKERAINLRKEMDSWEVGPRWQYSGNIIPFYIGKMCIYKIVLPMESFEHSGKKVLASDSDIKRQRASKALKTSIEVVIRKIRHWLNIPTAPFNYEIMSEKLKKKILRETKYDLTVRINGLWLLEFNVKNWPKRWDETGQIEINGKKIFVESEKKRLSGYESFLNSLEKSQLFKKANNK